MIIYSNGVPRELTEAEEMALQPTPRERIEELKGLLLSTDYKTLKYIEGQLSDEEFAECSLQRAAWRAEINYLEGTLE